jgi:hypothetical protein
MILNEAPDLGGNFSAIPAHYQDLPNGTTGQTVSIMMSSEWTDGYSPRFGAEEWRDGPLTVPRRPETRLDGTDRK